MSSPPRPSKSFAIAGGVQHGGERVVIYGTGGIGKSSLAALAPEPLFMDLEQGTRKLNVKRINVQTYQDVRDALAEKSLWKGVKSVVIDTGSKLQELTAAHILGTVKADRNELATSLEGFGYGKGYRYLFEHFCLVLADLDAHAREGRNVVMLLHDRTEKVPNPAGDDYLCFAPQLLASANNNIADKVKGWCDHLLFLQYDRVVTTDGLALGKGSRTIWPREQGHFQAKSRSLRDPIPFAEGSTTLWDKLFSTATAGGPPPVAA